VERWRRSSDIVTAGRPGPPQTCGAVNDLAAARAKLDDVALLRELKGAGLALHRLDWPAAASSSRGEKTAVFPDRPESHCNVMVNPEHRVRVG